MKAIVYDRYGAPDVLEYREVRAPSPKDNEALVKVHAASINSWDWDMLTGRPLEYRIFSGLLKPKQTNILGCDIAGRIEKVGREVKAFQPGDRVFGDLSGSHWGGFAEYACARESELTVIPDGMTDEEAAAIPQAGLLALQGLNRIQQIEPGQNVLINGGGGGVGTFAIQMAKASGAHVTGVDSAGKLDIMRRLGADHAIDYTSKDFTKNGIRYDLILDVKTDRSIFHYQRALHAGGAYITVGGKSYRIIQLILLGPLLAKTSKKRAVVVMHKPNQNLHTVIELFESGKLKPVIDRCFPLKETANAFSYYGEGRFKGKVVINIWNHV